MGKRRTPYQKQPFESTGVSNDTSANIYMSMLMSCAWRDLSCGQKTLYVYCKAQYYAEKNHPKGDKLCFTMNRSKWCSLYHLYSANNPAGFQRDMIALIEHGFIDCIEAGAVTRTKNIYRFSSMWQNYGTERFSRSNTVKTLAMMRKEKKEVP